MRVRSTVLLTAGVLLAAGLPAGTAAAAAPPDTIHVSTTCGASPDGSTDAPFCSISAAVAVVRPGQTIVVDRGYFSESVSPPSGEPGRPITIRGYRGPAAGRTNLSSGSRTKAVFDLSGVHDVVIEGISFSAQSSAAVVVDSSSDVTLTDGWIRNPSVAAVDIKGSSRRVTVSRMSVEVLRAPFVSVGPGVSETVLASNSVRQTRAPLTTGPPAITVADAPRTTITNNTIVTDCATGIRVTGASADFSLYNTLVRTLPVGKTGCEWSPSDPASAPAVSIDGIAASGSRLDYNVIDPAPGGPAYSWAGAPYRDLREFQTASGQGAHDIVGDAGLADVYSPFDIGWGLLPSSPAIDSASADAPGLPATDLRGNAHADKPDTPNSGGGFVDRGATELVSLRGFSASLARVPGGGPMDTVATVTAYQDWAVDGPVGTFALGSVVNRTGTANFTFDHAGRACVYVRASDDNFRSDFPSWSSSACVMLGAPFTPVTPQRVLDTRTATGVPRTTPLNAREFIDLPLPAPAASSDAVVLNVTVANPTTNGYLKVYPGDPEPNASNINFAAHQTIPNLVTVPVVNGRVRIKNGSAGTVHVLADLAGYYGGDAGLGFTSGAPIRVLDTRTATGVPGTAPLGSNGRVTVDLSARVPAGTAAVALNVAVTKPTVGGHLTAYPAGGAVPATSNLNFVTGQTANNMVIAPVVDGKIAFAYGGSGTVHVLADLNGWFGPGAADSFLPLWSPYRMLDTREIGNMPIGPGQAIVAYAYDNECYTYGCSRSALVANLTVTGAQSAGYLTVYPYGQPRPAASVLNFNPNETIANLVTVGLTDNKFMIYNSSAKPVHVVVDGAGYYLSPPTA
ncbi:hypothetical protein O7635_07850 [Asanoa sp. WMMD1127]|uniref:hypothetical protein n=1 Tax=Asanoa sp. WMMD1127 TaxID=3016107 RepID=UPI0024169703|nr:hypothetical protein [Asanoa sp. WMMD1127]MDG4821764.1 hypothetical protein [Asanoa sp. WMMD1127]